MSMLKTRLARLENLQPVTNNRPKSLREFYGLDAPLEEDYPISTGSFADFHTDNAKLEANITARLLANAQG